MKMQKYFMILTVAFLVACSGPARDEKIETTISKLTKSDQIVAIYNFGQVAVSISGQSAFEMSQDARQELAEEAANKVLEIHPDSSAILISFGRTKPELQQISYAWENDNGKLKLIKK